jgi:hypothetical protein
MSVVMKNFLTLALTIAYNKTLQLDMQNFVRRPLFFQQSKHKILLAVRQRKT